jgi:dienelactone hydrolase
VRQIALAIVIWAGLGASAAMAAETKVTFASADGDIGAGGKATSLSAVLFKPDGNGPFPAVVAAHGCGGMYDKGRLRPHLTAWGAAINKAGIALLVVDSLTPRGVDQNCTQPNAGKVTAQRERNRDMYGALAYLLTQPFVVKEKIGLLGWSHGGMTGLATIGNAKPPRAPDAEFAAVALLYPACQPFLAAQRYKPRAPVQMYLGGADDWTPAKACTELQAKLVKDGVAVASILYDGAYHNFDWPDLPVTQFTAIKTEAAPNGVHTGGNPKARVDVLEKVPAFFRERFGM